MVTTTAVPLLKGSELGFAVEAGSSSPNHLLAGIDLDIHPGEALVILGANGAGKSTLLRLLAGVESPSAGEIRVLGEATQGWSRHRWARALAYVPQLQASFFPLTVRESLHLADLPFDQSRAWKAAVEQLVEDALESWELKPLEDRTLDQLSGGEQQRCQLARSWIQLRQPDCHLWLLDEPMSALDVHFQYVLLDHLQRARGMGKGVVMALHQLGWVRRLASHALLLRQGGMIAAGSVDEVLTVPALAELYDLTEEQASELLG